MNSNLQNRCALNIFLEPIESDPIAFTISFSGLKSGRWEGQFKQAPQSAGLEGEGDVDVT